MTGRLLKRGLVLLGVLGGSFLALLWVAAGRIASPERREVQGYHREFLENPTEHGVMVTAYEFLAGEVPTLVVQPDAGSGPGERGKLLRGQLGAKGIPAEEYGEVDRVAVLCTGGMVVRRICCRWRRGCARRGWFV